MADEVGKERQIKPARSLLQSASEDLLQNILARYKVEHREANIVSSTMFSHDDVPLVNY